MKRVERLTSLSSVTRPARGARNACALRSSAATSFDRSVIGEDKARGDVPNNGDEEPEEALGDDGADSAPLPSEKARGGVEVS